MGLLSIHSVFERVHDMMLQLLKVDNVIYDKTEIICWSASDYSVWISLNMEYRQKVRK